MNPMYSVIPEEIKCIPSFRYLWEQYVSRKKTIFFRFFEDALIMLYKNDEGEICYTSFRVVKSIKIAGVSSITAKFSSGCELHHANGCYYARFGKNILFSSRQAESNLYLDFSGFYPGGKQTTPEYSYLLSFEEYQKENVTHATDEEKDKIGVLIYDLEEACYLLSDQFGEPRKLKQK